MKPVRPAYPQTCMELHPDGVTYCTLPLGPGLEDHRGPHGWDYEAGKRATVTRRKIQERLRAGGLGSLADRLDPHPSEIEGER